MTGLLITIALLYAAIAVPVCGRIGYEMTGRRGLALGVLFGPLGLMICVLIRLSDQLASDLQRLEDSIGHLDRAMSTLLPWGRPKRRPPA
ncbi:MAG: hypothetical protein IT198_12640 [Acidimicrobiia bacterium]|nr:hypothetical protein [Acidimicrobiia bacterium]